MKIKIYTLCSVSFLVNLAWILNYVASRTALKGTEFAPLVWGFTALGIAMFAITVRAAFKAGRMTKGSL